MAGELLPVQAMLVYLCSAFPGGQLDSFETRAYVRALEGLSKEVLLKAVDRLVDESAAGRQFYPRPTAADVKGACGKVIATLRDTAYRAALPDRCPTCGHERSHTGARWKDVSVNGVTRLEPCDCRTLALAARDRVAEPLALPSVDLSGDAA